MLRLAMDRLLFCDETWSNSNDNTCRTEFVLQGKRPTPRVHMKRAQFRLMVWGRIGVGCKGPLFIFTAVKRESATITGSRYPRTVGRIVRQAMDRTNGHNLQFRSGQRAAARHAWEKTFWLMVGVVEWPPYSPDLNPAETVWASLHRRVTTQFQGDG